MSGGLQHYQGKFDPNRRDFIGLTSMTKLLPSPSSSKFCCSKPVEASSTEAHMAASVSRLGFASLRYISQASVRRKRNPLICPARAFHPTPLHHRPEDPFLEEDPADSSAPAKLERQPFKFSLDDLDDEERSTYTSLSEEDQEEWREEAQHMHDHMTSPEVVSELQSALSQAVNETAQESQGEPVMERRIKPGFFAMGEADEQNTGEDEEFEGDDITSLAHSELEQHREIRHYARLAAWEMPLLSSTHAGFLSIILICQKPASSTSADTKEPFPQS